MSKGQGFLYGQKQHLLQEELHLLVKARSSTRRRKRYSLGLMCKRMPFSPNPPMKTIRILRIPVELSLPHSRQGHSQYPATGARPRPLASPGASSAQARPQALRYLA